MALPNAPRVLVADDQADVVTALRLLLRGAGLNVDAARSVQEVRSRLGAAAYDLLLMDLNYARDTTSGREGLELLSEVHAKDPLLPVVVMTGWGGIDTAVEAMRRGARTFVHKPWDNTTLAGAICREVEDGMAARRAGARAAREHEEARTVQRALLPGSLPEVPSCEMDARWQPAGALGGDCYDVQRLSETSFGLSIADVCGKGLPAALLMANLQASVRAFSATHLAPADIACSVNRALCGNADTRRFVTFFYVLVDSTARTVTFSNAGHNPPLLVRASGAVERLSEGGVLLGIFNDAQFEQRTVPLEAGDRLVLFTDGITEAQDSGEREFSDERLVASVLTRRDASARQIVHGIFDDVLAFAGGALQDDATVLTLAVA